jgi:2'-5' RNA ligase
MKQRKIFLGIALPQDVSRRLAHRMEKWADVPLRVTKEGNLFVSLLFLGHILDEAVARTCEQVSEVCKETQAFDIDLDNIVLVPEQGKSARQLWFMGNSNEELRLLREAIEKKLSMFSVEKKSFRPHVTLARVRKHLWQEMETVPEISEKFSVFLPVDSVRVYESTFQKGKGLVYEVLADCPLEY